LQIAQRNDASNDFHLSLTYMPHWQSVEQLRFNEKEENWSPTSHVDETYEVLLVYIPCLVVMQINMLTTSNYIHVFFLSFCLTWHFESCL
jgi:hypothetical protein